LLLLDLNAHATQPQFVYSHTWRQGDLVIWDNRCTMHRGRPHDEMAPRDHLGCRLDPEGAGGGLAAAIILILFILMAYSRGSWATHKR
jgi:alpha-ketoglutarate-dependent taurine dioxygenase